MPVVRRGMHLGSACKHSAAPVVDIVKDVSEKESSCEDTDESVLVSACGGKVTICASGAPGNAATCLSLS